jgi:hypothetical protein
MIRLHVFVEDNSICKWQYLCKTSFKGQWLMTCKSWGLITWHLCVIRRDVVGRVWGTPKKFWAVLSMRSKTLRGSQTFLATPLFIRVRPLSLTNIYFWKLTELMTYDSKRWSIWTKCCPNAFLRNFPLSLIDAFQFKQIVMCLLFALIIVFKSSLVIFCWVNGKCFDLCFKRKLSVRCIWKISFLSSLRVCML